MTKGPQNIVKKALTDAVGAFFVDRGGRLCYNHFKFEQSKNEAKEWTG